MDVQFSSPKQQQQLSDSKSLRKSWGEAGAKKIMLRLQQLAGATNLDDMRALPGRCHELSDDRAGSLAVDLHKGFRLVFQPTADPPPVKDDGGLDWSSVDSVTVLEIVDYH